MPARLYSMRLSHPAQAVRLMLEQKGIEHEIVEMVPGLHPLHLRGARFSGNTTPAVVLPDGRKVQGSIAIGRALDELAREPALHPGDPAIDEAEAWGEAELQPVARRLFRYAVSHDVELRTWVARHAKMPAPRAAAALNLPVAHLMRRAAGADRAAAERDIAGLSGKLDRADELIAAGTIGSDPPNAADLQIATSIRALLSFRGLEHALSEDRPSVKLARRRLADYPDPPVDLRRVGLGQASL